jgi:hypothetical protein
LNFLKPINTSMLLLRYKQDSSHTCIIITSFLSKERSLVVWLWSRVPDKILVESASVLILTLHFCLFKEQHQDISPDFSILSLRNVYPSTINNGAKFTCKI